MAVNLILWCDSKHDESVTEGVAVLAFTVGEDAHGVGEAAAALEEVFKIIIGFSKIVAQIAIFVVGIGSEEGSLGKRKESR